MVIEHLKILGKAVVLMEEEDYQALLAQSSPAVPQTSYRGTTFGTFIRLARGYQNLSQAVLAKRCGWSQPFHSAVERGDYALSKDQVDILFKSLKRKAGPTADQLGRLLRGEIGPNRLLSEMGLKPSLFPSADGHRVNVGDPVLVEDGKGRRKGRVAALWPQSSTLQDAFEGEEWRKWLPNGNGADRAKYPSAVVETSGGAFQVVPTRYLARVSRPEEI